MVGSLIIIECFHFQNLLLSKLVEFLLISAIWFRCRIPAVGFPALVGGHHVPVHSARNAPSKFGATSIGKRGKDSSRKSGSKRGRN